MATMDDLTAKQEAHKKEVAALVEEMMAGIKVRYAGILKKMDSLTKDCETLLTNAEHGSQTYETLDDLTERLKGAERELEDDNGPNW